MSTRLISKYHFNSKDPHQKSPEKTGEDVGNYNYAAKSPTEEVCIDWLVSNQYCTHSSYPTNINCENE